MYGKEGKIVGLALLGVLLIFWCQPAFCGAATTDDVLKRLNDLSDIIQQQQNQIERLKQELKMQRKSIEKGQKAQKEEIKTHFMITTNMATNREATTNATFEGTSKK